MQAASSRCDYLDALNPAQREAATFGERRDGAPLSSGPLLVVAGAGQAAFPVLGVDHLEALVLQGHPDDLHQVAKERLRRLEAGFRPEEIEAARARVQAAEARIAQVEQQIEDALKKDLTPQQRANLIRARGQIAEAKILEIKYRYEKRTSKRLPKSRIIREALDLYFDQVMKE